jgi:Protein of unknown function (DUF2924)
VTSGPNLAEEVQAFDRLGLDALREAWRARYGPPPKLRSQELLRLALAWRIQADAQGGLDRRARDLLRRATPPVRAHAKLSIGVQLAREWKGVRHAVVVVEGGFLYRGQIFKSLSQIARTITGSRWNGPRFFGLRAEEDAP